MLECFSLITQSQFKVLNIEVYLKTLVAKSDANTVWENYCQKQFSVRFSCFGHTISVNFGSFRIFLSNWSNWVITPFAIGSVEYCDECVCLSVCLSDHISGTTRSTFTKFFVHVAYGRGSVLLWRRSDTLHISGFVDDVILAHQLTGCSTSPPGWGS